MKEGRKIYSKVVLDWDGNILEEEAFTHYGEIARCDGAPDWKEEFPEDVRELEIVRDSPDKETFYKRLSDQQTFQGQAIRIPGKDAGEEDIKAFKEKLTSKVPYLMPTPNFEEEEHVVNLLHKMGAPEEKDGYTPPELEVAEGLRIKEGLAEEFREIAHPHNLTQKQYEGIVSSIHEKMVVTEQNRMLKEREDREALKKTWGAAYDDKLVSIKMLLLKTGAPESYVQGADSLDSQTLSWLDKLTKAVQGEGKDIIEDGTGNPRPPKMTPAEAKIKQAEIRNNKDHPYHKPNDPGHKAAKAAMRELYILADPDNATKPIPGARHSFT